MPDPNGSRKATSKNEGMKKSEGSKPALKTGDKRKAEREAARSPPRRRPVRRSRSSSSGTSDSSSSRSGSADSSGSDSSRSGKRSPQKPQPKQNKGSEGSKSSSRPQTSKIDVPISSKSDDVRGRRELPKKPPVSGDAPKAVESTRTDVQPRIKPTVSEDAKPAPPLSQSAKASSGPSDEKSESAKLQLSTKPSVKPSKPNALEHDKVVEERNKSPVNIPPFTRVLVEKLTRNVTKAHVTEIFSVWGEVSNVEMPADRLHPEFSRSYAYVTYANPKCAADAVNYMNGGQVDGETIRVTEVFSRPSTTARTGADVALSESSKDRSTAKRDYDKPVDSTRGRKDGLISSSHHRSDGANDRPRDYDRPSVNDQDRRREAQDRDRRDRDRDRERERERQRDRSRDADRPRRGRRGSSGSPFANRMGAVARQRSPVASARYRRASPLSSRQDASRHGRSRSPKPTKPGLSRSTNDAKPAPRRGRATSRSSSSSSSDSGSSNSSSSSRSGSSSSSSSSSSSRSRS